MKTTIIAALASITLSIQAMAHIGETFDQCVARYGNPLSHSGNNALFRKNGFTILTSFGDDGKCQIVSYSKGAKNVMGCFEELSQVEIDGILASNASGWSNLRAAIASRNYISGDSKVMAVYGVMDHQLQLCTVEWFQKSQQKDAESQKKAVQGL